MILALRVLLPAAAGLLGAWAAAREPAAEILFVSRAPLRGEARGAIPGFGPHQRAARPGGRLMRLAGGEAKPFGRAGFDAADPTVSPDGKKVAWAALEHRDSSWRIQLDVTGPPGRSGFERGAPFAIAAPRYDDLDPCWVDDSTLVFASTRDGQRSEYDGSPVPQLFRWDLATGRLTRLTAERNGAEEPSLDRRTGRIVYSRWWFNRTRPAQAGDTVNVWQAISIRADGTDPRLVAPRARELRRESLYQPAIAKDGSLYGVLGDVAGLAPAPGKTEVVRFRPGSDRADHVAGAHVDPRIRSRYGSTSGLASPSACSPAPLADGRLLVSLDAGGRGDYGLWIVNADGSRPSRLVDLPGTLELDAVPLAPWKARRAPPARASLPPIPGSVAALAGVPTFRFLNRDVFGAGYGAREARDARARGPLRIRFFAALPSATSASGDTVVLVREAAVGRDGRVDAKGLPAGVPMFEQLVDAKGRVLQSAHGPAHVAGFNMGIPGETATCVGCHRGHSRRR